MSWLRRLLRRRPPLPRGEAAAVAAYRALPRPDMRAPLGGQRAVVLDVESSGLDPHRDRLISIAAIAVRGGLVRQDESYGAVLRQEKPSAAENIVIHGIGGGAQAEGVEPSRALAGFLAFAGKDPLVGFHANFDRVLIGRAADAALGLVPENAWFDLAAIAPALFPAHADRSRSLDDWLERFGIENYRRHDALADALATAQLLLVVLAEARRRGLSDWAQLAGLQSDQRLLERMQREA